MGHPSVREGGENSDTERCGFAPKSHSVSSAANWFEVDISGILCDLFGFRLCFAAQEACCLLLSIVPSYKFVLCGIMERGSIEIETLLGEARRWGAGTGPMPQPQGTVGKVCPGVVPGALECPQRLCMDAEVDLRRRVGACCFPCSSSAQFVGCCAFVHRDRNIQT